MQVDAAARNARIDAGTPDSALEQSGSIAERNAFRAKIQSTVPARLDIYQERSRPSQQNSRLFAALDKALVS